MGIFTQNHYNLLKLQAFTVFNTNFYSSNQTNPSFVNDDISVNFQMADKDVIQSFNKPGQIHFYQYNGTATDINYWISSLYSTGLCYGDFTLSSNTPPNVSFIKFITTDFEEDIDNQYFSDLKGYRALSEQINVLDNGSIININYTRSDTTPLYGIQIITTMQIYSDSKNYRLKLGTYLHKFDIPITDTAFTISISYNYTNGDLNVS